MSCVDKLSGGESKQPGWKPEAAKDADLLGVTIGCSPEEVSSAYRQAPLWAHPDKGGRLQSLPIKNTATKIAANERIQCHRKGFCGGVLSPFITQKAITVTFYAIIVDRSFPASSNGSKKPSSPTLEIGPVP